MLEPKKTKFRRHHRGNRKGMAKGGDYVAFGSYGLKALQPERITSNQIEAARVALTRHMKRAGKVWTRLYWNIPPME